ncbi:L,D-transpeptidase family protein [Marinimicrobium alkaliphilum]|uniref:L,D-transpeptidase family protein n=1 Tax=Marinimicrobium alkaliphilum TaxID=2202654 RepID=UPI000DB980F1|nr:L,D-transpeptidase family protein [Marinimicrobium alkaliphilum]
MPFRHAAAAILLFFAWILPASGEELAFYGPPIPDVYLPLADEILVDKSSRAMYLISDGEPFRRYDVALGRNPEGHKKRRGDRRTPEGTYYITRRNLDSDFHIALHISYPSPEDRARANARGQNPGGNIVIHGQRNSYVSGDYKRAGDWTDGCIALSNAEMEELWHLVPIGTPIRILP